jgi:putative flippase GtrA
MHERINGMNGRWDNLTPGDQHPLRHGFAFLICGTIAFTLDGLMLKLLVVFGGLNPIVARLGAIAVAMVAGWLAHRTFTFALTTPPTLAEFLRYIAVGWVVSAINYGVFVAIMLARPTLEPLFALVASSGIAMVFAYVGMRFAAFQAPAGDGRP